MDALKAELALKRKTLDASPADARPTKYMRKGDLAKLQEQQARSAREEKERLAIEESKKEPSPAPLDTKVCTWLPSANCRGLTFNWSLDPLTFRHRLACAYERLKGRLSRASTHRCGV